MQKIGNRMKILTFIGLFAYGLSNLVHAEPLTCHTGPVVIEIAQGNWQVTSCSDSQSLVFVTMKDNPSMPFVFIVKRSADKVSIRGEGNGNKVFTQQAYFALKGMSMANFDELVQATLQIQNTSSQTQ